MELFILYVVLVTTLSTLVLQVIELRPHGRNRVVVDTSSLIDGRIVEIIGAGFLRSQLVVPKFVLDELQFLADGSDSLKRERARFGLDNVRLLQDSRHVQVVVSGRMHKQELEVDSKLVNLAKKMRARLLTHDFNLLKVAEIQGVEVLNVNTLAQALRPAALPGEEIKVKIVQKGSGKDQGVGYLTDGTMIVVSRAGRLRDKEVMVSVTRSLQTEAGRMLFAELIEKKPHRATSTRSKSQNRRGRK